MPGSSNIEGLYVHVPFCDGKCHYCAFYSVPYTRERGESWLAAVIMEWEASRADLTPLALDTVFIGGGTPSLLPPDLLERLVKTIRDEMGSGNPIREWTCEANPGSLDSERLDLMKSHGVNRISLGIQSLQDEVLCRLGRRHTLHDIQDSVRAILAAGFTNWNLDLIACVPGVTLPAWRETLHAAVQLGAPHISVYALTREEGTRLAQEHRSGRPTLLDDDDQLQMLEEAEKILVAAGLNRYEISNYARPGFECQHNLSCWRGGNYLGLGCAASSRVGARRWSNKADLDLYTNILNPGTNPREQWQAIREHSETLSPETDAVERLIFGLRMAEGIELNVILGHTGLEHSSIGCRWRTVLERLSREGLLVSTGGRWRLTGKGRAMADHVAVELIP